MQIAECCFHAKKQLILVEEGAYFLIFGVLCRCELIYQIESSLAKDSTVDHINLLIHDTLINMGSSMDLVLLSHNMGSLKSKHPLVDWLCDGIN